MTEAKLIQDEYEIRNAKIANVDLSMGDHGCLTFNMLLEGQGWSYSYGGFCLGHGHLMRIMEVVGVEKMSDLNGKIVRVALTGLTGWGDPVNIIGNAIDDKWFNLSEFFSDGKG